MSSVAAIVLTYNRIELLKACLAAIRRQTTACDMIIVVDNGSTDETRDFLSQYDQDPRLVVVTIERNRGPAAGFNAAFRAGLQSGAELLWVMDDDVIPAPTALTELLRGRELLHSCNTAPPFYLSVARSPDGSATNVPDIDTRGKAGGYPQWPGLLHEGLLPVRRATFVSTLFPRSTLVEHGLPCAGMYMWGEDSEYTLRVTRDGPGFLVGRSQVEHVRAHPGSLDIATEPDPKRVALHRILVRNLIYTSRKHMDWSHTRHTIVGILMLALRLIGMRQWRKAGVILSGVASGLVFSPAEAGDEQAGQPRTDPVIHGDTNAAQLRANWR